MIKLIDIKKSYKSGAVTYPALNGINLNIDDGEYVAIVGTSGSGKSTLINIIGGMDKATEGQYIYNDMDVSSMKQHDLHLFRKQNISFIFQRFALLNQYTVYENVEIPLLARGVAKKERKEKIIKTLMQVGIQDLYKKKPSELSGGEQQRCAIARALVSDSSIVLADEPTGALDKATGLKIMDLLEELHKQGKTLIIVTHDMDIAAHADRLIRIEDGVIIEDIKNENQNE